MDKEKHFTELADKLHELSDEDKTFSLWILLKPYRESLRETIKKMKDPKTATEYMELRMMENIDQATKDMEELLGYELW